MDQDVSRHMEGTSGRALLRRRLLALMVVLGLLAGMGGAISPAPAAAQDELPFVYYAGTSADSRLQVGGAWFSDVPPYIFFSHEPGGVVIAVHYLLSAEVWAYEGTWQFLTTAPYVDCAPYEGGFTYYVSSYDPGRNLYSNWIPVDICSDTL